MIRLVSMVALSSTLTGARGAPGLTAASRTPPPPRATCHRFEDIADPAYSPDKNEGITFEEAMATIHVIRAEDKKILTGMEALTSLYDITGMGWLFKLAKLPVLSSAAEIAYKVVSKNRQSLGGAADGLLALGRINMEEKGEGSCTDLEGECREKPPPVDAEGDAAAAAAEERRAKLAEKKAAEANQGGRNPAQQVSSGTLENAARVPPPPTSGSLSDRRNILGVYDMRRSKSEARALRAAPVDTETGELIDELITVPLEDTELSTLAAALTSIIKHFGWQGNVGIGLPGRVEKLDATPVNETLDTIDEGDLDSRNIASAKPASTYGSNRLSGSLANATAEVSTSASSRASRLEMESYLKNAVGRDVVAMAGSEATGYGEMFYGAGKTDKGVTICVTLGLGIGVSLFDEGVLAHNPDDVDRQVKTWYGKRWENAELPRLPMLDGEVDPTEEEWQRWAERVDHYLQRIEAVCDVDNFIICGRASVSFDKWVKYMKNVKTPVQRAEQGITAAVQGAAQGAHEILTLRRDTARVRSAIGHSKGLSPQKLTDDQLGAVFDEFDTDQSGELSMMEIGNAINKLGIRMSDAELKELFIEMDSENTGSINKREFVGWWKDSIGNSSVEIIHTLEEYDQVLEDADGTDSMTVLMVGVTYCKPCKAFTRKYADFAERFSGARFIKVFGNENKDMTVLCRDQLKVKSTPTFYFFRNKDQVHMHTGANPGKFEKFIMDNLRENEPGYGSPRQFEDPVEVAGPDKGKTGAPAR